MDKSLYIVNNFFSNAVMKINETSSTTNSIFYYFHFDFPEMFRPLKVMFSFSSISSEDWNDDKAFSLLNLDCINLTDIQDYQNLVTTHPDTYVLPQSIYYLVQGLTAGGGFEYATGTCGQVLFVPEPITNDIDNIKIVKEEIEHQRKGRYWGKTIQYINNHLDHFVKRDSLIIENYVNKFPMMLPELIAFREAFSIIETLIFGEQTKWLDASLTEFEKDIYLTSWRVTGDHIIEDNMLNIGFDIRAAKRGKNGSKLDGKHYLSGIWIIEGEKPYWTLEDEWWEQIGDDYTSAEPTELTISLWLYPERKILTDTLPHIPPPDIDFPEKLKPTTDFSLPAGSIPGMYRAVYVNELYASLLRIYHAFNIGYFEKEGKFYYPKGEATENINKLLRDETNNYLDELNEGQLIEVIPIEYSFDKSTGSLVYGGYTAKTDYLEYEEFDDTLTHPFQLMLIIPHSLGCWETGEPTNIAYFAHSYNTYYLVEFNNEKSIKTNLDAVGASIPDLVKNVTIPGADSDTTDIPDIFEYGADNIVIPFEAYIITQKITNVADDNNIDFDYNKYPTIEDVSDSSYEPDNTTDYGWLWHKFITNGTDDLRSDVDINHTTTLEMIPRASWSIFLRYFMHRVIDKTYKVTPTFYMYKGENWGIYYPFSDTRNKTAEDAFPLTVELFDGAKDVLFPTNKTDETTGEPIKCNEAEIYKFTISGNFSDIIPAAPPCGYYRDEPEKITNSWSAGLRVKHNKSWEVTVNSIKFHECIVLDRYALINEAMPLTNHYPEKRNKFNEIFQGKYVGE